MSYWLGYTLLEHFNEMSLREFDDPEEENILFDYVAGTFTLQ